MHSTLASRPTRIRYGVIAVSTLMGVLLYLDRFCIGIAEPFIRQDLGLSKQQMGIFMSAFFWPYVLTIFYVVKQRVISIVSCGCFKRYWGTSGVNNFCYSVWLQVYKITNFLRSWVSPKIIGYFRYEITYFPESFYNMDR